ncbi:MAG: ATP-binding cassette domain-containing protein [Propionibacteriales bacterium]|nr:ATP-binding cassette domain-containing protein [Propionibacteriales bacterium]
MTLLEVTNVTKKFGGVTAIDEVSFRAEAGRVLALIGPNGAGKSTMFNVISGNYAPTSGTLRFDDRDVTGANSVAMSRLGVSRTFQKIRLFKALSVMDNVVIGAQSSAPVAPWRFFFGGGAVRAAAAETRKHALEMLDLVGLGDVGDVRADTLSYGQQRMLEIARALATKPRLLLIDEPAAGLNQAEADGLVRRLRLIRDQGITLMLVEHNMDLVMDIAEDIVVMNFGKKIAQGAPREIQENPDVIRAYLGEEAMA